MSKYIKGFENEIIEVSDYGEWIGNNYIDYKYEYQEKEKEINLYLKIIAEKEQEIERLNNIIKKLEQENAVLKTQVVNKDKYSYGIRMGSDKE